MTIFTSFPNELVGATIRFVIDAEIARQAAKGGSK